MESPTSANALTVRSLDAHTHLDKYSAGDLDSIVDDVERAGIVTVSVSVDATSYERARTTAERCRLIVPTFGIQPFEAPRFVDHLDEVASLCSASPMIGAVGLDHAFVTDTIRRYKQREVFETLLDIAVDQRNVVNVHSTGAERETAAMLRARALGRVITHWYSGDIGTLRALINDGRHRLRILVRTNLGHVLREDPHLEPWSDLVNVLNGVTDDDEKLREGRTDNRSEQTRPTTRVRT